MLGPGERLNEILPGQYFDGLKGGDLSLYVYGKNNPLGYTDPLGLEATLGQVLGAAGRGAFSGGARGSRAGAYGALAGALIGAGAAVYAVCTDDDDDKDICDKEYEFDIEECHDRYGNGLRGEGFKSNLRGCIEWAGVSLLSKAAGPWAIPRV